MGQVITLGELLLRLTPPSNKRIRQAQSFRRYFGGAEANVAINLSQYGHETYFLSALPSNDLGNSAMSILNEAGVDNSLIKRKDGRIGVYFYEEGFSLKPPQVIYDRANSSFLSLPSENFNWDTVFENKSIFHVTGITLALNKDMRDFTFRALKEAKSRNVSVSFDFNYRSQLWSITKAKKTYLRVLPYVDIGFLGYKDLLAFLDVDDTLPKDFDKSILKEQFRKVAITYGINYLACTNREIISHSKNKLTGYMYFNENFVESSTYTFEVLERIGGGDAFASGILHGVLNEFVTEKIVEFGTASSVLKHFVYGDYTQYSAEEVDRFINEKGVGNFR